MAALLWPDHEAEQSRQNLRQLLATIRRAAGETSTLLLAERDIVRFSPQALVEVDAHLLDDDAPEMDASVAAAYRGAFLYDMADFQSNSWTEWLLSKRQMFEQRVLLALRRLTAGFLANARPEEALATARRSLSINPWDEEGHRGAMRAFALAGQRGNAVTQFHECRSLLASELGVEPEPATIALFDAIRSGEILPVSLPAPTQAPRERRLVTALVVQRFCSDAADPEDVAPAFEDFESLEHIVDTHGGTIVQHGADWLLAFFGTKAASEGAARQAISAGLAMLDSHSEILRGAVHAGIALVTPGDAARTQGALGQTARALVELADPRRLVASDACRALTRGFFKWEKLSAPPIPALGRGTAVHVVTGSTGARNKLEASAQAGLSALVGRGHELDRLVTAWSGMRGGSGRSLLVVGEPGVGKSRLLHEFRQAGVTDGARWLQHECLPQFSHVPFHVFGTLVHAVLALSQHAADEVKREAVRRVLADMGMMESANLAALQILAGVPAGAHSIPPQVLRRAMQGLVIALVRRLSAERPLILVIEDLHWCDSPSLKTLAKIAVSSGDIPTFMLMTGRPNDGGAWQADITIAERIELSPLDGDDTAALAQTLLPKETPTAVVESLVARAGGVPLFVEELALTVGAKGANSHEPPFPDSLHELMLARLDRLPMSKAAGALCATIGMEFSLPFFRDAARRISSDPLRDDVRSLDTLVEGGLLVQLRRSSQTVYRFRHALIQEAIYAAQPRQDRRNRHAAVAAVLKDRPADSSGERSALIAWHLEGAGQDSEAVLWWAAAAEDAFAKGAADEALSHGQRGLKLIDGLVEDGQTMASEVRLRLVLGAANTSKFGLGARSAEEHFHRALRLCDRLPASSTSFSTLMGCYGVIGLRWRWPDAKQLAGRILNAATELGDPTAIAMANFTKGHSALFTADFPLAIDCLSRVCAADFESRTLPVDYRPYAWAMRGGALWMMGRTEDGLAALDHSLDLALKGRPADVGPPFTTAIYFAFARRDDAAIDRLSAQLLSLCQGGGLLQWKAMALVARGLVADGSTGLSSMDEGLRLWEDAGLGEPTPSPLILIAAANLRAGRLEQAVAIAEKILHVLAVRDGQLLSVSTLMVYGDALQRLGRIPEAKAAYEQCITSARAMKSPPFEAYGKQALAELEAR